MPETVAEDDGTRDGASVIGPTADTPRGVAADIRRWLPALILAASVGALATALIAQYGFGLEPCPLCIYQRVPYVLAGLLALAALVRDRRGESRLTVWSAGACALIFLVGGAIAFYHVGVEQQWWASAVCGGDALPRTLSLDDLQAALSAPPPKACDAIDWTFLGLSMATWNVAASAVLAAVAGLGARRMAR